MKNSTFEKLRRNLVFTILSAFILLACDTSGDDPLPEEPLEKVDPKTLIPIEEILVLKFGNADEINIFPSEGKNLGFLSGSGEYSLKFSADPEKFNTPERVGVEFSVLGFPAIADTIWLYQNNVLKNTFLLKEGKNEFGVANSYSFSNAYANMPKTILELQQKNLNPI